MLPSRGRVLLPPQQGEGGSDTPSMLRTATAATDITAYDAWGDRMCGDGAEADVFIAMGAAAHARAREGTAADPGAANGRCSLSKTVAVPWGTLFLRTKPE